VASKKHVLDEIKRTAAENGGVPLGKGRFERETGIRESDWSGRYWARWGDAVQEAGFDVNHMNERIEDDVLLRALADLVRQHGRFPTTRELILARTTDPAIPSATVFSRRYGSKTQIIARLSDYCSSRPDYSDVADRLVALADDNDDDRGLPRSKAEVPVGYVYLLKSGRHYKIGRTNADGRRQRELSIQLPEKARRVHVIKTDDPVGIERYWHQRFADRRVRPDAEWFDLTREDVAAFSRRTFQ
jgi:Meiotically up-regulated gene 113